ncbi:MAG: hypothetical protein GWM98_08835 [Nitrospinaceae bacterium]|nr:DUF211 domain-containing protein [Nitrospinaceae bacterium]NIR54571.1 DUF211 domain-containing protein [Nitrospinaceae bacterium]NIS84993.1 DUF211 domain-containing protein [Nitrospinaceae bacterium]NIT81804.1 DUF211 domain-containing protein [Nitrospinaceae bacterium]NIU44067.1 DUF211 domain-containing protein [Nitrospinaceae bacterium]
MAIVKRILLDVLKPHQPGALEFASALADLDPGYRVNLKVEEVDENTESIILVIEGEDIQFDAIDEVIKKLGGTIHSVDEVEAEGNPPAPSEG